MLNFRLFLEKTIDDELAKTLEKLPAEHLKLSKGYKIRFENGCDLKGYPGSVGLIHINDKKKKVVQLASPWRYPKEFALLHEIGHLVWEHLMTKDQKKEWTKLITKQRSKLEKVDAEQNDEELFCQFYAQHYSTNKLTKFDCDSLDNFISKL